MGWWKFVQNSTVVVLLLGALEDEKFSKSFERNFHFGYLIGHLGVKKSKRKNDKQIGL